MCRVRGAWLLCPLLVGGCDVVWRLDEVQPSLPPDARSDAPGQTGCEQGAHDEDGDGVTDACDRCPGIADDQHDADDDGVGDACDPSATAHNELALFISFAADEPWRSVSGTWTRDGESLVFASPALDAYSITLFEGTIPEPPFVVEYHFSIDTIEAQVSGVTAIVDANTSGSGVTCGLQRQEGPIRDVVRSTYPQASVSSETVVMAVTPGGYRVVATYDRGTEVRCSLLADQTGTSGATTLSLPSAPAPGALGMRALRVTTHIHYIAIYR